MKKILLPSLFALGFIAGSPLPSYAQNIQFVPPATPQSGNAAAVEDDALNYFARTAKERKAMEAKKAAAPEGHVPASELEYLPEELELDGKAKLKIENGQIRTDAGNQNYGYCEDFEARGEAVPDGCIQKGSAEQSANAAASAPSPSPASLQPQTLNEQLEAKGNAAPDPVTIDTATPTQNNVGNTGDHVEKTAVVDKARGAKTNIISNTDTGVRLDY